jgi:hypothetical protein
MISFAKTPRLLLILTLAMLATFSCQKEEDEETALRAAEKSLFVTVNGQITTKISGAEDFLTITSQPDPSIATAEVYSDVLQVTGVGVGSTSVTVDAEGNSPVTVSIAVAKRKFDGGTLSADFDGGSYTFSNFATAWDSLGIFSCKGTTWDYEWSLNMEGINVTDNGTFAITQGSLTLTKSNLKYVNTGNSGDRLTLTNNDNSGIKGTFTANMELEGNPSNTLSISAGVIDFN